jgi:hypothetical protein
LTKGGTCEESTSLQTLLFSSILTNTEGPWVEKDKDVDRHWDFSSTWLKGIENIGLKAKNDKAYSPLRNNLVFETFCEPIEQPSGSKSATPKKVQPMRGSNRATFSRGSETKDDPEMSWSPLVTDKPGESWTLKTAPSDRRRNKGHDERVIQRWETKRIDRIDSEDTSNLEPYWMFDMRKKKEWPSDQKLKYEYNKTHMAIGSVQKPYLVMDIAYTCPKQSSQKKRVVMVEIDGEDKASQTARTDSNLDKTEFKNIRRS